MKIDGGCHCGLIKYEAVINRDHVGICHCTDCQTLSGSAFRVSILAAKDNFKLIGDGRPKSYFKTTEEGEKREQAFCPECGTPIYASGVGEGRPFSIRAGTCRQRAELAPKIQIWCRSAQPWLDGIGSLPKVQEQPSLSLTTST